LYLKGFGDTARFSFCATYIANIANFKDIEMGPLYSISEPFEVQTKVIEVPTGTNDFLSNADGPISISLKFAKFAM